MGQAFPYTPAGQGYISELHLVPSAGTQLCRTDPLFPLTSSALCSPLTIFTVRQRWGHSLGCSESCLNTLLFALPSRPDLLTGSFLWCRKHTELSRPECQHLTCAVLPLKQLQQELEFLVVPLTQTQHPQ